MATYSTDKPFWADDVVGITELSASGTAGSTTFLRGDNAWSTVIVENMGFLNIGSTGSGSSYAHEGTTTMSSNGNLNGVHFYTNFTLNNGVTATVPNNSGCVSLIASNSITINGTIDAIGAGSCEPGPGAYNAQTPPAPSRPGTNGDTQPAGGGGAGGGQYPGPGAGGGGVSIGGVNEMNVIQAGGTAGLWNAAAGVPSASVTGALAVASFNPMGMRGGASGGGGGGEQQNGGGAGGRGGGCIILMAPTVTLANTAVLNTTGGVGGTNGADGGGGGGGGAGNVYIVAKTFTDNGATFTMNGGAGGNPVHTGDGAAGRAGVKVLLKLSQEKING